MYDTYSEFDVICGKPGTKNVVVTRSCVTCRCPDLAECCYPIVGYTAEFDLPTIVGAGTCLVRLN